MKCRDPRDGFVVWLTGVSGAGKTTLARLLAQRLRAQCTMVELLDGDVLREQLSPGLGFTKADRDTHVRRIGFICELLSRNGVAVVVAAISPYRAVRDEIRSRIPNFLEVHVECPLAVLVHRDVKGLYKRALAGEISAFTGISDPYEHPLRPELVVNSAEESPEQSAERLWCLLQDRALVPRVLGTQAANLKRSAGRRGVPARGILG
jgi:adenylyl-sulfate kinase